MTDRERFLKIMNYEEVDRGVLWPVGVWEPTLDRWKKEGMPEGEDINEKYGAIGWRTCPIYFGFCPSFERKTISEDESTLVFMNFEGIVMKEFKEYGYWGMPQFLEFPVKTRDDFKKIKSRLDPAKVRDRFPTDWKQLCAEYKNREFFLWVLGDRQAGFFGPLRNLMGLEELSFAFYDDIVLVEEMLDNRADLIIAIMEEILKDTDIDCFGFWEDMAYKTASLLSPALFKKYLVPRYRRVTDFLRKKGVKYISVDSDGYVMDLIPLWLEGGINVVYPFEVQAGMDPIRARREFGKDLRILGGIDKRVLAWGKDSIKKEIDGKISLMKEGGYVPWPDHSTPPDVSYENVCFYFEYMKKALQFK